MSANSKDFLKKFCLESSFLGLKYFYLYPDILSRCYWGVSLIMILFVAWALTWLLYSRFLEMPTRITIDNQYEPVQNLPYPSIAICSPNQITLSALHHFNRTLVEGNRNLDFGKTAPLLLGFYELIGNFNESLVSHVEDLVKANRYHAIDVMGMVAQKCEDFLKLCIFEGNVYPQCQTLFYPILTRIGMCCIFNSVYQFRNQKRNEKIKNFTLRRVAEKYSGAGRGLQVVADYNPDDAVDGTVVNAGAIRVMVMESSEFPSEDESNLVRPSTESFHIIHPIYTYCSEDVKALPSNSRKCLFEHEMHVRHFGEYSNSDCSLLCYVEHIERHCHCLMHFVPHVRHERACNISSIPCINTVRVHLSNWHDDDDCECPRDCVSYSFRSEMMLGNLLALEHLIINPYKGIVFNRSTSLLKFYFSKTSYVTKKQETVMSVVIFFSNLGGVFGLCLGCSIISLFELLFYIYMTIKNKFKNRGKVQPLNYIN